ncbi:MAG TPA: serine/threonine protein kinase [Actinophytocola sp.]|uniref:protein kinase domain-containing protein n=1 Tax=Actinophytocola sp. TaxID=1872138 RepID=UPI002DBB416D|nr:serine/threonine protein kinase [Actinophytocola sp.]HEU5470843.1 serine/threonine protein kinase [Actinophytocola sp.]
MGSDEDKRRRQEECDQFEQRHRKVLQLLRPDDLHAGNLVLTLDFFAHGTRFYKVTRRIDAEHVAPHRLPAQQQVVLLRTLVDSLRLLHEQDIVHGDLKPDNVLLRRPKGSDLYSAKLIDFDDAYPAKQPPPRDIIGGDPLYGAPEWLRYLRGETAVSAADLTQAVDMFAFGLLVHTYLFGAPPAHAPYDCPAAAVIDGVPLVWDRRLGGPLRELLGSLTRPEPGARPDVTRTAEILDGEDVISSVMAKRDPKPGAKTSRVRVNVDRAGKPAPIVKSQSRLRINVNGRRFPTTG